MLDHHLFHLGLHVEQARHAELLAMAEKERRAAPGIPRSPDWRQRMLAGLGAHIIAMGQRLARAADVQGPGFGGARRVEE
jgi:hypothetical protein